MLPKIASLSAMLRQRKLDILLAVDGGITPVTARQACRAGANVLVAGSAIFGRPDRAAAINALRAAED
jgi:ribulose-phosphate 3-epimerase